MNTFLLEFYFSGEMLNIKTDKLTNIADNLKSFYSILISCCLYYEICCFKQFNTWNSFWILVNIHTVTV